MKEATSRRKALAMKVQDMRNQLSELQQTILREKAILATAEVEENKIVELFSYRINSENLKVGLGSCSWERPSILFSKSLGHIIRLGTWRSLKPDIVCIVCGFDYLGTG
ncbi:hypothetical protein F0562_012423 [Nyssa sinensis]|uniref:Uncharacterized protein n=1 Tax=Nyssa sinensis TaxID=561372 RepID=A0A5J4ZTQ6_9ASTE|nr:hypothetical protein F0562_012423 [Nyssa sinensis]